MTWRAISARPYSEAQVKVEEKKIEASKNLVAAGPEPAR